MKTQNNLKLVLVIVTTFFTNLIYSQNNYSDLIYYLKNNNERYEIVSCPLSTALVKAEYYAIGNESYVVVYFKQYEYDVIGEPYIYCGISLSDWYSFRNYGATSWGKSFDIYIKAKKCNPSIKKIAKPEYNQNQTVDLEQLLKEKYALERAYSNSTRRTYSRRSNSSNSLVEVFGKEKINYKYGFGASYGENIYSFIFTGRLAKNMTIDGIYNKFVEQKEESYNQDLFKKQFGISTVLNFHTSIASNKLFLITGIAASYSKSLQEWSVEFEEKFNPVLILGLDYNFQEIPVSIGLFNRLDFGDYSNYGIAVKYILNEK